MRTRDPQIKSVHIFMMVFFALLALYFRRLENLEDYFIYGATAIMSIHFWRGAVFFIRTIGPSKDLPGSFTDLAIMGLKIGSIYAIRNMPLWFLVNSAIMVLGVSKYYVALRSDKAPGEEDFVRSKISIETAAVIFLLVLAGITWSVDSGIFRKILSGAVLGVQPLFLFWALCRKKIYGRRHKSRRVE